jgi:hypothetical protein
MVASSPATIERSSATDRSSLQFVATQTTNTAIVVANIAGANALVWLTAELAKPRNIFCFLRNFIRLPV